jgi:FkbM family methyltransferase
MAKLSAIWKTLTITKNPIAVLSMKRNKNRKTLTFRNGLTCNLTWPQFRLFRDAYPFSTKYSITQIEDDLFKIEDDQRSKVVCNSDLLPVILDLLGDFVINQVNEDKFCIRNEEFTVVGSSGMLLCIQELKTGEYECDCRSKVVLDIGGFEGESAVYFWAKKAKKIKIYEPVATHVEFIKENTLLNTINAEICQAGIGNRNETKIIHYNQTDPGFGFLSEGAKTMKIKVRNVSEVIEESGAEIAKFDCEGAEESLVNVPNEVLRKIEYYLIEVHSKKIRKAILEKFQSAGFTLEKETPKPMQFSVLGLKRGNNE